MINVQRNNGGDDQMNDYFCEKIIESYQICFDIIKSRNK